MPTVEIHTTVVALRPKKESARRLDERLRAGDPPVVARIHAGRVLIDPRTLLPGEDGEVLSALARVAATN
jgi:L-seryl-tRNA(Ser) seleniumtransferase